MPKRVFKEAWSWDTPYGGRLNFRAGKVYSVPRDCAAHADANGLSTVKAQGRSPENKMLAGAPENKRAPI